MRRPGRITVHGDTRRRRVVNIYEQHAPGWPTTSGRDTRDARIDYFREALARLARYLMATQTGTKSVAFPARIGCGLAAGDWTKYQEELLRFSRHANQSPHLNVQVTTYRMPGS